MDAGKTPGSNSAAKTLQKRIFIDLDRPRSVFGVKTSTFGLPFGIDFSFFSENGESVL